MRAQSAKDAPAGAFVHAPRTLCVDLPSRAGHHIPTAGPSTGTRRISNQKELRDRLKAVYGAELVYEFTGLTKDTMHETLSKLAQTRVLLGPHGAGLTTLLFLPSTNASLVELRPVYYGSRKGILSFVHLGQLASVPVHVLNSKGSFFGTISVDVDAVMALLSELYPPAQRVPNQSSAMPL